MLMHKESLFHRFVKIEAIAVMAVIVSLTQVFEIANLIPIWLPVEYPPPYSLYTIM
jgi:hypothetical protein